MPETSLDLSSGALLGGRYRVVAELGRGGMASVHRARDEVLDRPVAIKIMHAHLATDATFRERFQREARAAAALSHPNVVTVHDTGEEAGTAYLVMELIEGDSLRDVLDARGRLSPAEALALIGPAAAGLGAAHAAGLVHRDVKPENVLYAGDGTAKVTDFGLARAAAASRRTFDSGVIVGSPHYLSPEAVEGGRTDSRSDVYALGILLFECLTGRTPFQGDTPLATAVAHTRSRVPRPSDVVGGTGLDPELDAVVARATARDPDDRHRDATAFATALTAAVPDGPAPVDLRGGDGGTVVLPTGEQTTAVVGATDGDADRPRRWRRWLLLALAAAAVGAFLVWDQVIAPVTPVPGVVDLPRAEAVRALEDAGFAPAVADQRTNDLTIPEGEVVTVRPADTARRGNTVTLVLSAGPRDVTVPSVDGEPEQRAVATIRDVPLVPEVRRRYHEQVPEGRVIATDPAAGTTVEATGTVTVTVSRGREPIEVPTVVGAGEQEALDALEQAGLAGEVTGRRYSDQAAAGVVVEQSPSADTQRFRGDPVELVVSRGPRPFPMPDVEGQAVEEARGVLTDRGLEVSLVRRDTIFPFREGRVEAQDPPPETDVRPGEEVTLFVWR